MESVRAGNRWLPDPRRLGVGLAITACGVQAIVVQSLLVREAIVLMFGSELAWGIVLSSWLIGVAVGALFGGFGAPRLRQVDLWLTAAMLAMAAVAALEIWAFRGARAWLGVGPGDLVPLPKMMMGAVALVTPCGFLVGVAFPLACSLQPESRPGDPAAAGTLGRIYALESAGSLLGGAAFSFWAVEHLAPIETVLACGTIAAACAAFLLATRRRWLASAGLSAASAGAGLVALLAAQSFDRGLAQRRWRHLAPGYERVAEAESRYQHLALGKREGLFALYCDGQVSTTFPDPYAHVPLTHFKMCQHPAPKKVLLLGGGAEGVLAEVLRYPVVQVTYLEPDPRQIELIEPYLTEADRRVLSDERVRVYHADARHFVKTQKSRFDLVIARLPDPTSALRARFYTDEFFGELRRAMSDRAVLCMDAAAAPSRLSPASAEYVASIRTTLQRHFPEVVVGWGDPAQILAGTAHGLIATDPTELVRRYDRAGVLAPSFDPLWFEGATDWLEPAKLRQRADELDAAPEVQVSTDLRPVVYMQRLTMWERMTAGASGRTIKRLRGVHWPALAGGLTALACLTLAVGRIRGGPQTGGARGAVALSIGATGLVTMALSIIWLFAFQNLYGYVYQRIGWIIALFMGGLVIGSASMGHVRRAQTHVPAWRRLIVADLLLAGLTMLVPLVLPALGAMQGTALTFVVVEWSVSLLVLITGVLGGAAFALAGEIEVSLARGPARAAGAIVGADHVGACLGALLTGVVLMPVFGAATAAALLAGIKLATALVLALAARSSAPACSNGLRLKG